MKGYLTVKTPFTGLYEEKKSKFLSYGFYVETEEEAEKYIAEIKKKDYDGRHHCFAYRLLSGVERLSDDGEPSGTGGRPIMDLLISNELKNVLIIVTRYFGGTLLGVGPLKRAYMQSAKDGLEKATVLSYAPAIALKIKIPYSYLNRLELILECGEVLEKEFSDEVFISAVVHKENFEKIEHEIREMLNGRDIFRKKEEILYFFKK